MLVPKIYDRISRLDNVIFFANYFEPTSHLDMFRDKGFKIYMLTLGKDEVLRRNEHRIKNEGYEDASPWIDGQLKNHKKLLNLGLIDTLLDATLATEVLADIILESA